MALRLDDVVADSEELGLTDREGVGELESTEPAPTATKAMFDDCNQVAVNGSVSATV